MFGFTSVAFHGVTRYGEGDDKAKPLNNLTLISAHIDSFIFNMLKKCSLQLDRMADIARDFGEEVLFSRDAGGFVCNHVFFTAAHLVATLYSECRCGFVHLPMVRASDERLARFVEIARTWIRDL